MTAPYFVKAIWDSEADVWISETDIPGLVIEAGSLAEFEDLMRELAPETLAANASLSSGQVSALVVAHERWRSPTAPV